jgi:methionyl aminopeptidase
LIHLKSAAEIETIARAGEILAELYRAAPARVVPGVSTAELDRWAEAFIRERPGAEPAFKGLYGFPATLCVSTNHEGYYADAAITLPVGRVTPEVARLLEGTREALHRGIAEARVGNRLGDVGAAIQEVADAERWGVVRELVGHGVGRQPHEEPQVPNFGTRGRGVKLLVGMVLAIEPMFNLGTAAIRTLPDRWTVVTADRKLSAHFEHTVAITDEGPRILTDGGTARDGVA